MSDELVRWISDQLDIDTALAAAAAEEDGPDWHYDGHAVVTREEADLVAVGSQDFLEPGRGKHIATWDPARVLREIDAKRQIIAEHALNGWVCSTCDDGEVPPQAFPCPTLRLLALPYADRPGYHEEWRP